MGLYPPINQRNIEQRPTSMAGKKAGGKRQGMPNKSLYKGTKQNPKPKEKVASKGAKQY